MATRKQVLSAGISHRLPCNGFFFQLLSITAPVKLEFERENSPDLDMHDNAPLGFWFKSQERLSYVIITSSISQEVEYIYSTGQTGIDRSETVTTLAQASVITDIAPVAVGVAQVPVIAANAARKRLIFTAAATNTGVIYLGGATVTAANSAIALAGGDSWHDDNAAAAAWYAIADTAAQSLRVSEA